jgi:hypothetical protein
MSFEALSRISRAVTLLPRAWLGSETLNIPVIKSVMRVARSRSRLARSRSRVIRFSCTACTATKPASRRMSPAATPTVTRWRRTYFRTR